MKYNPLSYIRSEKDILKLVNALIMNTKGEGEKSLEDFWVKAERLYYSALIGYIWYEAPEEERNFTMLLDLINASEARENDENYHLNKILLTHKRPTTFLAGRLSFSRYSSPKITIPWVKFSCASCRRTAKKVCDFQNIS